MRSSIFKRTSGMSLIEVMIGMVIGLIGIVVIMQLYLDNENFKRKTLSSGGAQINGTIALYSLERDVLSSGYNISDSNALGCGQLKYFYTPSYRTSSQSIQVAPVYITNGGTNPDQIQVMYGSSDRPIAATLTTTMVNAGAALTVDNFQSFSLGDLVIAVQGTDCTLMQLTSSGSSNLTHTSSSTTAPWNPASGGTFTAYTSGTLVFNLGKPTVNIYSINSGQLQQLRVFTWASASALPAYNATASTLVENIVDLRAQYGKDTNADGIVDTWDKTAPTTGAGWKTVLAIRVGIVARSQNYEKPPSGGSTCQATTSQPTWSGGTFNVPNIAVANDWQCYTYKVFETIMPLRNMIWSRS